MIAPFTEIHDARRKPARVQTQAQDVDRGLEQGGGRSLGQQGDGVIGRDHLPAGVDDHGGKRLVRSQHVLYGFVHGRHRRVGQPVGRVGGGVAAGQQQHVALTQRHVELLGEAKDHLAGRPRPPGFDERQVPGRHLGPQREVELGEPAPLPPAAQQLADRSRCVGGRLGHCHRGHQATLRATGERRRLPGR